MKTAILLIAAMLVLTGILIAADTNAVRRMRRPAALSTNTTPPTPQTTQNLLGPVHEFLLQDGTRIRITSTNTFPMGQGRRWLMEAARTIK